ncbi:hypothetical protein PENTCL1PPCAC_8097, partial [Pristionchus entomophagus]
DRLPHPLQIARDHINEAVAYGSQWAQMLYSLYLRDTKSAWSVVTGILCFIFFLITGIVMLIYFLLKTIYEVITSSLPKRSSENHRRNTRGDWRVGVILVTFLAVSIFTGLRISKYHSTHRDS